MKVLVGCEFSGIVRDAFIRKGHDAMSCDLLPTESEGPHYVGDIFNIIDEGWDLAIFHPPCTAICTSGNRYYANTEERLAGIAFVELLWSADIDKICIENPVGVLSTMSTLGKPTQYIQPWQFGHDASKKTGLWLKGLPKLTSTLIQIKERYANQTPSGQSKLSPSKDRWKLRSRTYFGIADAMANQWG